MTSRLQQQNHLGTDCKPSGGLFLLLLTLAFSPGCNTVEFYEMEAHASNVMQYGSSDAKSHLEQKVIYSMEGSAGGIGSSAGGGCGCY